MLIFYATPLLTGLLGLSFLAYKSLKYKEYKTEFMSLEFVNKHTQFDIKKLDLDNTKLLYYIEYKLNDKYYTFLYNTRTDSYFQFEYGNVFNNKIFQDAIEDVFEEEFIEIYIKQLI